MNNIPKTPREIKRSQLFDLFAKNLQVVKTNPNIHIEPDITDGYVCPICMKFFDRGALSTSEEFRDYLTLEDVPPKVLGGRPITLTCKICNNTAGTELDNHLINKLIYDEAIRGAQNTSIDAILTQENDLKVSVTVHIKPSEKISIRYDPNRSNPNHIKKFQAKLKSGNIGEFSLTLFGKHNENHANIALLRIAYLLAYSYLGYGFIMNVNLKLIRDQIQSPSQVLLPHWGVSNNLSFPDENLGVNIVKHPKELRAFLIVFDLKTAKSITRYGVLLPGPTNPGLSIYRWLAENNRGQQDMRINATHIPRDNYLTNPTLAFASHGFWNAVVND